MSDDPKSESNPGKVPAPTANDAVFPVDLKQLYEYVKGPAIIDVRSVHYGNLAIVSFGPRDAWIDFLQVPGLPSDQKVVIPATRVYLSHLNAVKLSEAISSTYQRTKERGGVERLPDG